jgi:acyl-CoA thioester hydrolase
MYSFEYPYRVRYADVDQMGFMYYGNYAKLYEIGRVEALRHLGVRYKDIEESGVWMPVYENKSRYIEPAKYDEQLLIRISLKNLPKYRICFEVSIYNEENKEIHTGETTLVFINSLDKKLTLCPLAISEKLKPFFEKP